jgi:plasmid stabilization system protein ParE
MRVEYHPLTTSDLNRAFTHYNRQRAGLGDELRTEVYASIERVLASPTQFSVVSRSIRRCLVHRFPYAVLFRIVSPDTLRVHVIRHHRRHPDFGLHRR